MFPTLTTSFKRQFMALFPAYLVMLAGGAQLAYGVFSTFGYWQWITKSASQLIFVAVSFHVTTIIGAVITSFIYNKFDILKIHFVNCFLMLTASILLTALPDSYACILTARLMFGLGFGSNYAYVIIYGTEISSPEDRKQLMYVPHLFLTFGMFFFSLSIVLGTGFPALVRLVGAVGVAMLVQSIPVAYFTLKPSHIFLLQTSSSGKALERLQFLNPEPTEDLSVKIEETQNYVNNEKARSFDFFGGQNISAFAISALAIIGYVAVFNDYINFSRLFYLSPALATTTKNYSLLTMMGTRLIGCICGYFILGRISTKLQFVVPAVIVSLLLIIFGILTYSYDNLYTWTPLLFFLPIEFLIGIGLGPIPDVMRSELFLHKEKPFLMAASIVFTEILHIIFIVILVPSDFLHWFIEFLVNGVSRSSPITLAAITLVCGIIVLVLWRKPSARNKEFMFR